MKRIFIILILASCFSSLSTFAQADNTSSLSSKPIIGMLYCEGEKYKALANLNSVPIPNESFRRINWLYLEFEHRVKKKSEVPLTVVSNNKYSRSGIDRTYYQAPTMHSEDIFGNQAKEYTALANKTNDPTAKSAYRQLAIASHDASIANLERTQAMERNMAGLELANSIGNLAFTILRKMVNNWIRQDLEKIVAWGLGNNDSMYSSKADAPELYLTLMIEEQPQKNQPTLKTYTILPRVKYYGEVISMAPRSMTLVPTTKKDRKKIKKGKRINPQELGYTPYGTYPVPLNYFADYPSRELNLVFGFDYEIFAMLLRQVGYDYLELKEALDEDQLGD